MMVEGMEQLKSLYIDAFCIKKVLSHDKNIDILLYLAKYNPNVTINDIVNFFGEKAREGLKELQSCNLVREENEKLTLTNEGIFQLDGLLSIIV